MDRDTRNELFQTIKDYNSMQEHDEDKVNMQDILTEIGSLENDEVEKAIEILKSKIENGE